MCHSLKFLSVFSLCLYVSKPLFLFGLLTFQPLAFRTAAFEVWDFRLETRTMKRQKWRKPKTSKSQTPVAFKVRLFAMGTKDGRMTEDRIISAQTSNTYRPNSIAPKNQMIEILVLIRPVLSDAFCVGYIKWSNDNILCCE